MRDREARTAAVRDRRWPWSLAGAMAWTFVTTPAAYAEPEVEKVQLRDAVSRALSRNTSVLVAAADVRRAAAVVEQVRAAALPTLNAGGSYTRLDVNQEIGPYSNQLSGGVTLAVPLLAPSAWAQWAHARDNRQLAALSKERVRRQVAVSVAHAYLAIIAQRRVVELNQRATETAQAHFDYAHKRFAQGLGSRLDEVRAEQELRGDEGRVESAYASLAQLQGTLGALLGDERPVDAGQEPELPALPDYDAAMVEAPRRPDLFALQYGRRAALRVVRDSYADFLPTLSLTLGPLAQSPSLYATTAAAASSMQWLYGWQAQLVLVVQLYDGGLRYGWLHERRALADQAEVNLQGALRQARVDIATALSALRRADRALVGAKQAAELAQRAVDIALLSYRNGASTNLEVIDAQRRARDADTAAVLAEDDVRQLRLDLLAGSGRFP